MSEEGFYSLQHKGFMGLDLFLAIDMDLDDSLNISRGMHAMHDLYVRI